MNPVGRGRECFPGSSLGRGHGHDIHYDRTAKMWRYSDNGELFVLGKERPCVKCGLSPNDHGGRDPCLGKLPGVRNACCGHGQDEGYIQFDNGVFIQGHFKIFNGPVGREHDPSGESE